MAELTDPTEPMDTPSWSRKNKPRRRVLVVGFGSLLEQGVQSLLAQEPEVQVWEVKYTDEVAFLLDVVQTRPDVILFHETGALDSDRIFDLLRAIPTRETLRVIILRSSSPVIDVYEKRTIAATGARHFLSLVLNNDHAGAQ